MTDLVAPLTGPYFPLTSSATPGTPRERPWRRAPEQPVTLHPQSRLCPVAVGRGASCSRQATGRLLATLLAAPVSRKWPLSSVTGSGSLNDSALGLMVYPRHREKDTTAKHWMEPRRGETRQDQPQQWAGPRGSRPGATGPTQPSRLIRRARPLPSGDRETVGLAGCRATQSRDDTESDLGREMPARGAGRTQAAGEVGMCSRPEAPPLVAEWGRKTAHMRLPLPTIPLRSGNPASGCKP